jgi:hypothetical protein
MKLINKLHLLLTKILALHSSLEKEFFLSFVIIFRFLISHVKTLKDSQDRTASRSASIGQPGQKTIIK